MNNLFRAEWYKMTRNRSFRLLLLVLSVSAVAYVLLTYFDDPEDGGALTAISGVDLWMAALSANQYIIKIGFGILAGFFISGEYANGTMKRTVSAGFSRARIITAKLLAFMAGSVLVALVFPLTNLILGSILLGFGSLPDASAVEYVLRTLGMTLLIAAAYALITGWFAVVLNDSGKTIGFSIVFFFFIDGVFVMLDRFIPWLDAIYEYSVLTVIAEFADVTLSQGKLWTEIAVSAATWAVFLLLGIASFRRKEIK